MSYLSKTKTLSFCKNQKESMTIVAVKKKLLSITFQIKMVLKKRQEISTETCQKKKKKQRESIQKIGATK